MICKTCGIEGHDSQGNKELCLVAVAARCRRMELQLGDLQKILYRARWHVSTDNFCDCRQPNGHPHKQDCLLFAVAEAVERSPKCCPQFEPGIAVHSEFCRNFATIPMTLRTGDRQRLLERCYLELYASSTDDREHKRQEALAAAVAIAKRIAEIDKEASR